MASNLSEIAGKLDKATKQYPDLQCIVETLNSDYEITQEFLEVYFDSKHPKRSLILRVLLGDFGRYHKDTAYFTLQGLRFILRTPLAPLSQMKLGRPADRDLIPQTLATRYSLKKSTYYQFVFEYTLQVAERYQEDSDVLDLVRQVQTFFVLSDMDAQVFASGYITNQLMGQYFPDSCPGLSLLNTLTFMGALMPELLTNLKAQDRLPAYLFRFMGMPRRSIPNALAFTDLILMHYTGVIQSPTRLAVLVAELKSGIGLEIDTLDQEKKAIDRLLSYFYLSTVQEYKQIGGVFGSTFQFNMSRFLQKQDGEYRKTRLVDEYLTEYTLAKPFEMKKLLVSINKQSANKVSGFVSRFSSDDSAIHIRDLTNIMTYSINLEANGLLSFDKKSPVHYSKILPSVAQFKLGLPEPSSTGTSPFQTHGAESKSVERRGKFLKEFEELHEAIYEDESDSNEFEELWNLKLGQGKVQEADKATFREFWLAAAGLTMGAV